MCAMLLPLGGVCMILLVHCPSRSSRCPAVASDPKFKFKFSWPGTERYRPRFLYSADWTGLGGKITPHFANLTNLLCRFLATPNQPLFPHNHLAYTSPPHTHPTHRTSQVFSTLDTHTSLPLPACDPSTPKVRTCRSVLAVCRSSRLRCPLLVLFGHRSR